MTEELGAFLNEADLSSPSQQFEVEVRLAKLWDHIEGADAERTTAGKLIDRTEEMTWQPPVLRFSIERHGAIARGGIYAELHHWSVNLTTMRAEIEARGRRQIGTRAKRLDVDPLVQQVAEAVLSGTPHPWVTPATGGRVRVHVGAVIPDQGPQQTLEGRRRRFRERLLDRLAPSGWVAGPWPTLVTIGPGHA